MSDITDTLTADQFDAYCDATQRMLDELREQLGIPKPIERGEGGRTRHADL